MKVKYRKDKAQIFNLWKSALKNKNTIGKLQQLQEYQLSHIKYMCKFYMVYFILEEQKMLIMDRNYFIREHSSLI